MINALLFMIKCSEQQMIDIFPISITLYHGTVVMLDHPHGILTQFKLPRHPAQQMYA